MSFVMWQIICMYVVEGTLETTTDPESLIGMFGFYFEREEPDQYEGMHAPNSRMSKISVIGSKLIVAKAVNHLVKRGYVPVESRAKEITTVDEAAVFGDTESDDINLVRRRLPNLPELLEKQVPSDRILLAGTAALWDEKRRPYSHLYTSAQAELVTKMEFDQSSGWIEPDPGVEGHRSTTGLVIGPLSLSFSEISTIS